MRRLAVVIACLGAVGACGGSSSVTPVPFRRVGEVALPGRATRFDYADVDPSRHLLVVAHLGDSQVVAVDLQRRQVLWTAANISSAHGVRIAPALGRVFATATGTDQVVALDESTGAEIGRAPTGRFPDGVAYDTTTSRALVSNKDGGTVTVVDADSLHPVGTISVGGDLGNVPTSGDHIGAGGGQKTALLVL